MIATAYDEAVEVMIDALSEPLYRTDHNSRDDEEMAFLLRPVLDALLASGLIALRDRG